MKQKIRRSFWLLRLTRADKGKWRAQARIYVQKIPFECAGLREKACLDNFGFPLPNAKPWIPSSVCKRVLSLCDYEQINKKPRLSINLNDLATVQSSWSRNRKSEGYIQHVEQLLIHFQQLARNTSIKLHYFHKRLDYFLENFSYLSSNKGSTFIRIFPSWRRGIEDTETSKLDTESEILVDNAPTATRARHADRPQTHRSEISHAQLHRGPSAHAHPHERGCDGYLKYDFYLI
ncbi:hypothetical protein EVAR_83829_1 [Eumeta japonica]|uniref:Uncharacterized protein n=1 Tax=Eumeta variegata TaxID=151549 RepID=A0A4C1WGA6_EUMVA|nr:hypothetical protein EVAR_83829_1 [Eumeta japonica]